MPDEFHGDVLTTIGLRLHPAKNQREVFMKKLFFAAVLTAFLNSAVGAEDAYHAGLRQQLQSQFQVTGGAWVLTDEETTTNGLINASNVTAKKVEWSGTEGFTKAVELKTSKAQANSWDAAVRFATKSAIEQGDRLLLVLWIRGIQAETALGKIEHIFEMTDNPYTKSLNMGQLPASAWQQWMIPFEAVMPLAAGKARYQINMGVMAQAIQIGGLAILNFGKAYTLDQLPRSKFDQDYDGREPGAAWRAEALARIGQIRKGPIKVKVVNRSGQPVSGAGVRFEMLRHEFGFGTAVAYGPLTGHSADDLTYQEKLTDLTGDGRGFNFIVFENALKWPNWENDGYDGSRDDIAGWVDWFRDRDIEVRGHNLVWPGADYLPDDVASNLTDSAYVRRRVDEHLEDMLTWPGIQGGIREWDAINEPLSNTAFQTLFGGDRIYADIFKLARSLDPVPKLFVNEAGLTDQGGLNRAGIDRLKQILRSINVNGGKVDGIGFQSHTSYPLTAPSRVYEIFDEFNEFDADLSITEYDARDVEAAVAGDYMEDLLTIAFSHPRMKSFLMWGFWDGAHWLSDAPLFNRDWSLKLSGERFLDLVFDRWWTDEKAATGRSGEAAVSGFYGKYKITVEGGGAKTEATLIHAAGDTVFTIALDTETGTAGDVAPAPRRFGLESNYPNPFNPSTAIHYSVPSAGRVTLGIYNLRGERIRVLAEGTVPAGGHRAFWDGLDSSGNAAPSGVYVARLVAGERTQSMRMVLMR
jgi:endo-1,4-beta-xylanase